MLITILGRKIVGQWSMRFEQLKIRITGRVLWEGGWNGTRAETSGESLFIPGLKSELILGFFRQANIRLMLPCLYSDWPVAILIT